MEELLTELRNKVLYLRNIEELSAKGELILLHKLNTMEKQLNIHSVSNAKRTVCEKHVCVESKVNVGYRVCVNCYALFPIAN